MADIIDFVGWNGRTRPVPPTETPAQPTPPAPAAEVLGRMPAPACGHSRVLVDQARRTLVCRDCGSSVDALDWLLRLAVRREGLDTQFRQVREQADAATRERDALRRQVARLKREEEALAAAAAERRKQLVLEFGESIATAMLREAKAAAGGGA